MLSTLDELRARLGDRYAIERELGRGGMGAVYLARDLRLDRAVALKVLPPEYAVQAELRERFLRETRTAASFYHPNIVPVYAIEESADVLAYVMGFVEGESLAERVKRAGPLSVREAVRLLQDVGYALAYAHGRGIVHRDIKPDNVMIERATGRALVMDFGVARVITAAAPNAGLTRVGEVVGTPEYMSPEQATGDTIDGRSDLYSLGLTAHFALTGRAAITGDSVTKVLMRQITEVLPPMQLSRPDLPPALAEAIDHCLAKDPAQRFDSAESLVEALDAAQLAAPEIPVAIRLFAQELGTLSIVVIAASIIEYTMLPTVHRNNVDSVLPPLLLVGVVLTRVLQTVTEARRLTVAGFAAAEVHRGLRAVMAERQGRRDELRQDARTRRARRRTVIIAALELAAALLMISVVRAARVQVGPTQYVVPTWGVWVAFSATVLFGISVLLLLRSPFRMPVGERLFRLVWLGPVGRGFVRVAGLGVARASNAGAVTAPRAPAVRADPGAHAVDQPVPSRSAAGNEHAAVASLENRVAELERWRNELAGPAPQT